MRKRLLVILLIFPFVLTAQKKPLDHSVYDSWQSIGERLISNDGKWVVYTVTPQEGDAELFIQEATGNYKQRIPRGYNATMTEDSRFLIFRIRPFYKDIRDARIKKKKPEDFPKDSIAIIELGKEEVIKRPMVRSYKIPEKANGWVAWLKEKEITASKPGSIPTQKTVDSLKNKIDSLVLLVTELKNIKGGSGDESDADDDPAVAASATEGSDLVLRELAGAREWTFKNVVDYYFNAYGQKLLMRMGKSAKDKRAVNAVLLFDIKTKRLDTILKGANDLRNFAMTEDGSRIAFLAERDTNAKSLQKVYGLYLFRSGDDSAALLVDKRSEGMKLGMTVSENGAVSFSKSGKRLFFGTAAVQPNRDTSVVDIDLVKLDIWNYKDDYLQTQQLLQLNNELKRTYLAVYDLDQNNVRQLGSKDLPVITQTDEGDGATFIAVTDTGRRVESQWTGRVKRDVYALDVRSGKITLVKKNFLGQIHPSSTGKYILLYDFKAKNYFAWDVHSLKNITSKIKLPLYNEDNDVPDDPNPYGIMGWHEGDTAVYVYDRYDVWKVDMLTNNASLYTHGRSKGISYRNMIRDPEKRFFTANDHLLMRSFNQATKTAGMAWLSIKNSDAVDVVFNGQGFLINATLSPNEFSKHDDFLVLKESFVESPDVFLIRFSPHGLNSALGNAAGHVAGDLVRLSSINPQQSQYNWGTAELYHWRTFDGKKADGILYKPEDFDSARKYPMIIYFYERLSDSMYKYQPPSPTGSRLNISFFVSRGYLVFVPDIRYTKGHPGKDAYNYIVSGAQALAKNKWVDGKNIGLQGQSWGGYQVAYLITQTNMFKAAWAGAPVVNMFSAYGGIRWESGSNRQFQYETGQSRIGATPWERPDLYIENSPFFHLKKVTTPLVIMSNDADGAVPWYQGIEFFTAMRRLGKKVWLLNYNGEAHNLVERKNKKDIQVREQQYFDWLLKGEKPPRWIVDGVPAVKKGKEWGLELVD